MELDDLSPEFIIHAYRMGYFPMPHPETQETVWFRPNPRAVLPLDGFHQSKSFQRFLKKKSFTTSFDKCFERIIRSCADRPDTWISEEFIQAYLKLHELGVCHSVEVWNLENQLVGGLYGVKIAGGFFAESMFSKETNASKMALLTLVNKMNEKGMKLLEVQFVTEHLTSLGAIGISDEDYQIKLKIALSVDPEFP